MSSVCHKTTVKKNRFVKLNLRFVYPQLILLIFLLLTLFQISCSRPTELNGEIFVVTRGAGNYKLGAVEIFAVPEKQFMKFAATKNGEKQPLVEKLKAKSAECVKLDGYSRLAQLEHNLCLLQAEEIKLNLGNIYYAGLPNPVASSMSNSDGKFTLKLPNQDKYIILAKASRNTVDLNEKYFWFVPLEANEAQQNIILSNNNMFDPETAAF